MTSRLATANGRRLRARRSVQRAAEEIWQREASEAATIRFGGEIRCLDVALGAVMSEHFKESGVDLHFDEMMAASSLSLHESNGASPYSFYEVKNRTVVPSLPPPQAR